MITVRFQNGFSVQYNGGCHIDRETAGLARIYDKKGGSWIATVQGDCIIEGSTKPCRTYDASKEDPNTALSDLRSELRLVKRALNKLAKAKA